MFRIACPDAEFLYNISKCDNDDWSWRKDWFESPAFYTGDPSKLRPVDFLVRETATPRLEGYARRVFDGVVIRSKYAGSVCRAMAWRTKFDTTYPEMSLYVEAMK